MEFNSGYSKKLIEKLQTLRNQLNLSFLKNNSSYFSTIFFIIVIHIFLSILQYFLYSKSNIFIIIARISGILIDFNSCLIIILVLRRFTTFLRNSKIGRKFIEFDEFINMHKFLGSFILFLGIIHALFHCINLCKLNIEII